MYIHFYTRCHEKKCPYLNHYLPFYSTNTVAVTTNTKLYYIEAFCAACIMFFYDTGYIDTMLLDALTLKLSIMKAGMNIICNLKV